MNLQDYAQYYIGARCLNTWFPAGHGLHNAEWILQGFHATSVKPYKLENKVDMVFTDSIKLVLRRLEDMTEGEAIDFLKHAITGGEYIAHNEYAVIWQSNGSRSDIYYLFCPPSGFHYLLQQGFDLFGLIEAGLAVDAKTLNP
jgi:hypothetical protein